MGGKQRHLHEGRVGVRTVAFVGWSGSGKTTLIERLLPVLKAHGHRVGYLKSHKEDFEFGREGKDTDRIYQAGAERAAIASPTEGALRWRIEDPEARDPALLVERYFAGCDIVLVEGFKHSSTKKIEVCSGEPLPVDHVVALVTSPGSDCHDDRDLPRFGRDDVEGLARFVAEAPLD